MAQLQGNSFKFNSQGFSQRAAVMPTQAFKASIIIRDDIPYDNEAITYELTQHILKDLISSKLIRLDTYKDGESYSIKYTAVLNVAPQGVQFMNVRDDVFTINNEHFNEEEIKEALKIAYPERLI